MLRTWSVDLFSTLLGLLLSKQLLLKTLLLVCLRCWNVFKLIIKVALFRKVIFVVAQFFDFNFSLALWPDWLALMASCTTWKILAPLRTSNSPHCSPTTWYRLFKLRWAIYESMTSRFGERRISFSDLFSLRLFLYLCAYIWFDTLIKNVLFCNRGHTFYFWRRHIRFSCWWGVFLWWRCSYSFYRFSFLGRCCPSKGISGYTLSLKSVQMLFHTSEFSKNLLHFFLICRIEISLILLSLLPSERYFLIHNRVLPILQDPLLLKDIFDQIFIIILIKEPHILPRSLFFHRLHPFLKNIWPQLLDHNLKMNSLLVKLLIDILVLSQLHLPDTFPLI